MVTLDSCPIAVPDVVGRIIEDEAVIILPQQSQVKVLNEVGAFMWSQIDGHKTIGEIAALLCQRYQVSLEEAQADAKVFFSTMAEKGMITFVQTDSK